MILENIRLALKDFTRNKLRTGLSMLGIIIGVASVITITSLGSSATGSITAEITQAGADTITVFLTKGDTSTARYFTPELAAEMEEAIPGINQAIPLQQGSFLLKYGREELEGVTIFGVEEAFSEIFHSTLAQGVFLTERDNQGKKAVIVLGSEVAETLFPGGNAAGKYVRVFRRQAKSFKVIGVLEEQSDTMGMSFNTSAYIPYETYISRLQRSDTVGRYAIGAKADADVLAVSEDIETYLTGLVGTSDAFRVISPSTIAEMAEGITSILNLLLGGVAAISLIVGGIGIMNIMLVSVVERTKEIGIRKALGASPNVIRSQFLVEAVSLTFSGGALGVITGLLLSYLGTSLLSWVFLPNITAVFIALVFSSFVGIFFGLYPAIKASKLDPVVALTFE